MSFNGEKPCRRSSLDRTNRKLRLVAISSRFARIRNRFNGNARQSNLAERIFNVIALELKLVFIADMAVNTSAAGLGGIAKPFAYAVL